MSGSTDETKITHRWREKLARELCESYTRLTREARNIAMYARQNDITLDVAHPDHETCGAMSDTQHEAAIERVVQNISDEDQRIGLVGYRLTDDQVRKIALVVLIAAYDAGEREETQRRIATLTRERDEAGSVAARTCVICKGANAARSGEAEGCELREALEEIKNECEGEGAYSTELRAVVLTIADAALAEHPEPRQAEGYSDTDVMRIIAFALRLGWEEGHKGEAVDHILARQNEVIDGALRAEPREDQPVDRAEEEEAAMRAHLDVDALVERYSPHQLAAKLMRAGVEHERQLIAAEHPETGERPERKMSIYEDGERGGVLQPVTGERDGLARDPHLIDRYHEVNDLFGRCADLLHATKAVVDEPLDERAGAGPTRTGQFARIEALVRDLPKLPAEPLQDGGERLKNLRPEDRALVEIIDDAHERNVGGQHQSGFCESCADFYTVASRVNALRHPHQDVEALRERDAIQVSEAHEARRLAEAEVERLREALSFYATGSNYDKPREDAFSPVMVDRGSLARSLVTPPSTDD